MFKVGDQVYYAKASTWATIVGGPYAVLDGYAFKIDAGDGLPPYMVSATNLAFRKVLELQGVKKPKTRKRRSKPSKPDA